MLLGYPRPTTFIERLDSPKSRWKNYTSFLPVYTYEIYWIVVVERHIGCADTGMLRLVIVEENRLRVINVDDRTPLIGMYDIVIHSTHARTQYSPLGEFHMSFHI